MTDDKKPMPGFNETDEKQPDPSESVEDGRDRHTEQNLDHGLKETFPASDPVSISPGAD